MSDFIERIRKLPQQKLVLLAQELQSRLAAAEQVSSEPIAIVGMGCRFPGADGPDAFWTLLRDGVDAIREVPLDRWNADDYYDPDPDVPNRMNTRWGGFIDDVDRFDAQFFGISPREAVAMDPQQRLLLEVCWEALEHAGVAPDRLAGTATGVFVGISGLDYFQLMLDRAGPSNTYFATGVSHSIASGRVSYVLGLNGPSISLDTACSSSLVAVHLACQSLHTGECRMALAGGSNVILTPETTISLSTAHMMAPDGRCKAFAASADGFVRGEGCGIVVLKRLSDAEADGDRVFAVIAGHALNQDGRSNGLTAPNGPSQEAVIREALRRAGCAPAEVAYVEGHGTGTSLGDPIEVRALGEVLGEGRPADRPVLIGSVKTNFGHLEATAGVAGLIKTVLALQHEEIPPHLHAAELNAHVPWASLPVKVADRRTPWPCTGTRRVAGVSSFGFSGTNAHLIVTDVPHQQRTEASAPERPVHALCLSARSQSALKQLAGRYEEFLQKTPDATLADVCFTSNTGRARLPHRVGIIAGTTEELGGALSSIRRGAELTPRVAFSRVSGDRPEVAFLFGGQGSQYVGMGLALYDSERVFRDAIDRCDELLRPVMRLSLVALLRGEVPDPSAIDSTLYTQPLLFAFEYALADLWKSWGVTPDIVMGHSLGEYAAACVAGVFSLEDGLRLVAERGRLMNDLPAGGAMAALNADAGRVRRVIEEDRSSAVIGAINGPTNTVISGAQADVERVVRRFEREGVRVHRLAVSHASHSPLLDPMLGDLERAAAGIRTSAPRIAVVSNVTGELATPDLLRDPAYWRTHAREPVQFESGMRALYAQGCRVFVEIGPAPVLIGMGRACVEDESCAWVSSLKKDRGEWEQIIEAARDLQLRGVDLDWQAMDRGRARSRVTLPTYPFERERYFVDAGPQGRSGARPRGALLAERAETAHGETVFDGDLSVESLPMLAAHRLRGRPIVPAPLYALLLGQALSTDRLTMTDLAVYEPLMLPDTGATPLQLIVEGEGSQRSFEFFSRGDRRHRWRRHAAGRASVEHVPGRVVNLADLHAACIEPASLEELYGHIARIGISLGPAFKVIEELRRGPHQALARVRLPEPRERGFAIHPAALDACFQIAGIAAGKTSGDDAFLLVAIDTLRLSGKFGGVGWASVSMRSGDAGAETLIADAVLTDEAGSVVAEATGLHLKRARPEALARALREGSDDWLYTVTWTEQPAQLDDTARPARADLVAPATIAEQLKDLPAALSDEHGISRYPAFIAALERLSLEYVLQAFRRLGWSLAHGESIDGASLMTRLRIAPSHYRLFYRLLEMLGEEGLLVSDGRTFVVGRVPDLTDPETGADALRSEYGEFSSEVALLRAAGAKLDAVLAGEEDPVRVLFADASLEAVERLTRHVPAARVFNTLVERVVRGALADTRSPLRVLEVGAGTGGTTASLLPMLPAERTEYVFTDVSQLFLAKARHTFADYPFVRYERLDIEQDPRSQGFDARSFDVIVAANVVHATRDLRETLSNIRTLLKPGGMLVLLEGTQPLRWVDLTFGLTSGWWRFEDHELRPSYPLLSRQRWRELVPSLGFEDVAILPDEEGTASLPRQIVLAARVPMEPGQDTRGTWIVAGGRGALENELASALSAQGYRVVRVRDSRDDVEPASGALAVDFEDPDVFKRFTDSTGASAALHGVIHLVATDAAGPASLTATRLAEDVTRSCRSGLYAAQALASARRDPAPRLWLVSRGVQPVDDVPLRVGGSPLWGLGRTIAMEHPDVWGGLLDLDESSPADCAAFIAGEVCARSGEDEIALRGGRRYVSRLVPTTIEHTDPAKPLREDRTYLLTGGSGGMGLRIAQWLVARGARHLVLVSRSGAAENSPEVQALRASGADVRVRKGDVSAREDMRRVLDEISASNWPLAGVIHAAGIFDDRVLLNHDWERFARVFAPKVQGGWLLHELTRETPLDFFVLFSSAASVLGPAGLGNYAAANAFLDALAHHRRAIGLPAVSLDWGAWAKTGMAEAVGTRREEQWTQSGFDTMSPEEGLEILGRALGVAPAQVAVLPVTWPAYLRWLGESRQRAFFRTFMPALADVGDAESAARPDSFAERLERTLAGERRALITQLVSAEVRTVLGFAQTAAVNLEQGLFDLGMDSLTAVELKNRLQNAVARSLPPTLVFDYPSVGALGAFLAQELLGPEAPAGASGALSPDTLGRELARERELLPEEEIAAMLAAKLDELD